MKSLNQRMASGAVWMFAARGVDKFFGLLSTLVLARLLVPEDFGIVAIATALLGMLTLFTNFSIDVALIQHPAPTKSHYDTSFTIGLLFGTAVSIVLLAAAYPFAMIYGDERLVSILMVLSATSFISYLGNVGTVNFRRELQFDKEFRLQLYRRLASVPIIVGLAFALRNYWALILGSLLSAIIGVLITYLMHPFRPRLSLAAGRELIGYSRWLFGNNILQFVIARAADFIVGKLRGPHDLGLFSMANEFGSLPTAELVAPINRATFPGYSRMAADREQLRHTYQRVAAVIALAAFPAGVGIAVTAGLFVPLLLGDQWVEAIPLVRLLALASALLALWTNLSYVLLAVGQPRKVTAMTAAQAVLTVLALIGFLVARVPDAAGWALFSVAVVMTLPNAYLACSELQLKLLSIAGILWRPAAGSAVMAAAVLALQAFISDGSGPAMLAMVLALSVACGAAVYSASILLLWLIAGRPAGGEAAALAAVSGWWRRRFKR